MVVGSGEPRAAPPGIRFGIHAFAHSRLLALAFQASLADQRRRISTGLPLAKGVWRKPGWPCSFMSSGGRRDPCSRRTLLHCEAGASAEDSALPANPEHLSVPIFWILSIASVESIFRREIGSVSVFAHWQAASYWRCS